jgi:catechol 2,3-dioxygenase-like lactoylglutathione lyase family enzyme
MANPFVHVELNTTDPDEAKAFYSKLFSWTLEDMAMGTGMTYTMIQLGEGTGGGIMKQLIPGGPSAWLPYVAVDDVKAATAKAKYRSYRGSPRSLAERVGRDRLRDEGGARWDGTRTLSGVRRR